MRYVGFPVRLIMGLFYAVCAAVALVVFIILIPSDENARDTVRRNFTTGVRWVLNG
jgi:hypothetical protein